MYTLGVTCCSLFGRIKFLRGVKSWIFLFLLWCHYKFRNKTKYIYRRRKESLKLEGGEEIEPCTECTYLGTIIDQLGENKTGIKHRISQTRNAINALHSIWCNKNITKNRKLYIYHIIS